MNENTYRRWEIGLKLVAMCGAVALFLHGFSDYIKIRRDQSAQAFWERQFPIYEKLARACANIAVDNYGPARESANIEFWKLYYGEARMVMDETVHRRLSHMAHLIIQDRHDAEYQSELSYAAFEIAEACRISIAQTWGVPLSSLQKEYTKE